MSKTSLSDNSSLSVHEKTDSHVGRLPFFEKLAFGMGGAAESLMANIIFALAMGIYHVALGVDARLVGIAISIPRLWDAFTDPLIGNISDNSRFRFGRRRPYIFCGAILTGLSCIVIWFPPVGLDPVFIFAFFLICSILYFTFYALFSVPLQGLGFELTDDYDERTRVMSFKFFIASFSNALFLPWAYKACFWFSDGSEGSEVQGVKIVGLIFGLAIMIFGVIPAIFCKERKRYEKQKKISLLKSLRFVVQNKPFIIICLVIMFVVMGVFMAIPLQLFMNLAYVVPGDKSTAATFVSYTTLTYGIMGFLSVPVINKLSARFGKKAILITGMLFVIAGCLLSWFYYTPKNPYLQILFGLFVSPGMACVWVLVPSCIADICDIDELATGLRREGVYGAMYAWLMKTGVACVLFFSGFIVSWTGFDRDLAIQTSEAILRLRSIFTIGPCIFLVIAILIILRYPINRQMMVDIQRQIKERKDPNLH